MSRAEAQRLADALDAISAYSDSECATLADAAALLRQWPEAGWMPIESAPKDGTTVLLGRVMDGFGFVRGYGRFVGSEGAYLSGWVSNGFDPVMSNLGLAHPTHWMPLPTAPGAAPSQQPAPEADVGNLEYQGNSVSFIHQKMTAYRSGIDAAWTALRKAGVQSDGKTDLAQGIERLAQQAAQSGMVDERWVIVCETVLDVGRGGDVRTGGRPELGYALISDAATYPNENAAREALQSVGLPLGWVIMPLSRLLPDLQAAPQVEQSGMVMVPREILDRFPEINPSNYDHDDACALNAWGVELVLAAAPQAVPQPLTREQHIALCEAQQWAREQSYFDARPQIDDNQSRRVFGAAFKAGYEAGYETLTRGITAKGDGNG